jgi:effector-binding domain-containing protein
MKVKEVKPANFLYFRTRTTLDQLAGLVPKGQEIYKEAVINNLPVTGPLHWHYYNFHGNPAEAFDLEIALPVGVFPGDYDGKFHIKRTQPFRCVTEVHEGDWLSIGTTYGLIMKYAGSNGLKLNGNSREIYTHVDLEEPSANVTEIQLAIE